MFTYKFSLNLQVLVLTSVPQSVISYIQQSIMGSDRGYRGRIDLLLADCGRLLMEARLMEKVDQHQNQILTEKEIQIHPRTKILQFHLSVSVQKLYGKIDTFCYLFVPFSKFMYLSKVNALRMETFSKTQFLVMSKTNHIGKRSFLCQLNLITKHNLFEHFIYI